MKFRPAREEDIPVTTQAPEELTTEVQEVEISIVIDDGDAGSGLPAARGASGKKNKNKKNKKDKKKSDKNKRRERRAAGSWKLLNLPWFEV